MCIDGSGSIDVDELCVMMRALGQNPSPEELEELVRSVDGKHGGEMDGQIQLREWLVRACAAKHAALRWHAARLVAVARLTAR